MLKIIMITKKKYTFTQSYNIPCKTNLVTIFIIGTLINVICLQKMADYGGSFSYEEYKNIANQQNSTLCNSCILPWCATAAIKC